MPKLKMVHEQYNDAKTWILRDNTEWDDGDNPAITDITSLVISIGYQSTREVVNSSSESYYISGNIKELFLPDGYLEITPEDFGLEETLQDGIYTVEYSIIYTGPISYAETLKFVLDGNIRKELYQDVSKLNYKQLIEENLPEYSELEDDFVNNAFFEAIFKQAYLAKDEEILAMMANLERRLNMYQ